MTFGLISTVTHICNYDFLSEPIEYLEDDFLPPMDDMFQIQVIQPTVLEPLPPKDKSLSIDQGIHKPSSSQKEIKEDRVKQKALSTKDRRREANKLSARKSRELKAKKLAQLEEIKEINCRFILQALECIPSNKTKDAIVKKLEPRNFSRLSENDQIKTISKAQALVLAEMKAQQEKPELLKANALEPDKTRVIRTRDLLVSSSEEF